MTAALTMSFFSDRIGRRKSMIFSISLVSVVMFLSGFSLSVEMFMCMLFVIGFGFSGYEAIVFVYITEISGNIINI